MRAVARSASSLLALACAVLGAGVAHATIPFAPPSTFPTGGAVSALQVVPSYTLGTASNSLVFAHPAEGVLSVVGDDGARGFLAPVNYAVGSGPAAIAMGGFDTDGAYDLAVVNAGSNGLTVLLGHEDGTYDVLPELALGFTPALVRALPVDEDNLPDLVVGHADAPLLTLLHGNGDGTFTPAGTVALPGIATSIAELVWNGGPLPWRVAVACAPNRIVLFTRDDTGFHATGTELVSGTGPHELATFDFGFDGLPEIAVADAGANTVVVLHGLEDGSFDVSATYATAAGPRSPSIEDVDGDGWLDLVTAHAGTGTIEIRRGDSEGGFRSPQVVDAGASASHVQVLWQDDATWWPLLLTVDAATGDLAVRDQVPVLDGSLTLLSQPQSTDVHTPLAPLQVKLTTPDGSPIADEPLWVGLQGGSFSDVIPEVVTDADGIGTLVTPAIHTAGKLVLMAGTLFGPYVESDSFVVAPGAAAWMEFQQQPPAAETGRPIVPNVSVLLHDEFGNNTPGVPVTLTLESGAALLGAGPVPTADDGLAVFPQLSASTPGLQRLIAHAPPDLERMSEPFLVTPILVNLFAPPDTFFAGVNPVRVAAGDLNGDAALDLVISDLTTASVTRLLGDGAGHFGSRLVLPALQYPGDLALTDTDRDGRLDLVLASLSGGGLAQWKGLGNGTFGVRTDFTGFVGNGRVTCADVTGDGIVDVLACEANRVRLLPGIGDGTFGAARLVPMALNPGRCVVADMNGDGIPDLVAPAFDAAQVVIALGTGAGYFAPATFVPTDATPAAVVAGDWNHDGRRDLAVVHSNPDSMTVLLASGSTWVPAGRYATGDYPTAISCADFDGDGSADLAVACMFGNALNVFLGHGDGTFDFRRNYAAGLSSHEALVVDVDGNGRPDVVTLDYQRNIVTVLRNVTGMPTPTLVESFSATATAAGVKLEWRLAAGARTFEPRAERGTSEAGEWTAVRGTPDAEGATRTLWDADAPAGAPSWYRLSGRAPDGSKFASAPVRADALSAIRVVALAPPRPNPVSNRTTLAFELPSAMRVQLTVVDLQGREVAMLSDAAWTAGRHTATLDVADLRAGIYFLRLRPERGAALVRRLVVVR